MTHAPAVTAASELAIERPATLGCDYQGYEFGAGTYPDSVCIDGSLRDADHCDGEGRVYLNEEDIPCPICRPQDAIDWWTERNALCWHDGEDENDEAGHQARAREAATSLVTDIRRNRGLTTGSAA